MSSPLRFLERPAEGTADGLLVLHHGRGADETDLFSLGEILDPNRRLHIVSVRAPRELPGQPGFHWYIVEQVGYPDYDTFHDSLDQLGAFHDELWERTGVAPSQTVFAGFSMGAVMSYSMALHPQRPTVAGILALSGFIPTVNRWEPDLGRADQTGVFISHGKADPVIRIEFAQDAFDTLEPAGFEVVYEETGAGHWIEPATLERARAWLDSLV